MKLDFTEFTKALAPHAFKRKTSAKDVRANNKRRAAASPHGNKVRKATIRESCTLGGHLSNRHNVSGRARIQLHGVDIFPDFTAEPTQPTQDLSCLHLVT